jgi:translation elongation factor EF-G
MGMALAKLAEEDPTFTVRTDELSWANYYLRYG